MIVTRHMPAPRRMDPFFASDPLADFARLSRLLSRPGRARTNAGVFPRLNLSETSETYIVRAEVPGIDAESLDVSLVGRTLTLSGRRDEEVREGASYHRRERTHGVFKRSVTLPAAVDPEKTEASFEHGVLTVTLSKPQVEQPRQIKVSLR